MVKEYGKNDVENKKGQSLITESMTEQERIVLSDFIPNDNIQKILKVALYKY